MADEEIDLGQATIVYEDPDGETARETIPNEHVAYFQDHWIIKRDDEEDGADLVRRIPTWRVYYVERSVEEFEEEVATRLDQLQSYVEELQTRLPIGPGGRRKRTGEEPGTGDESEDVERIEIDVGDEDEGDMQADTGVSEEQR